MGGRRIDYDGMIAVYDQINKYRSLTKEEETRLYYLIRKKGLQEAQSKHRKANKDKYTQLKREWRLKNPEKAREVSRKSTAKYRSHPRGHSLSKEANRKWRENNPDKVKIAKQKEKERKLRDGTIKIHIVEDGAPLCKNPRANLALTGTGLVTCELCMSRRNIAQRRAIGI